MNAVNLDKGIDLVDFDKRVIKHYDTPNQAEFNRVYKALYNLEMQTRFGIRYFVKTA